MKTSRSFLSLAVLAACALVLAAGCYYDRTEDMYPASSTSCDTTSVTYSATVSTIISNNCTSCHTGSAPLGGGIDLSTYTALSTYIDNSGSTFYSAIAQDGNASNMPKGLSKLADCDIRKIKIWLDAGKPNN